MQGCFQGRCWEKISTGVQAHYNSGLQPLACGLVSVCRHSALGRTDTLKKKNPAAEYIRPECTISPGQKWNRWLPSHEISVRPCNCPWQKKGWKNVDHSKFSKLASFCAHFTCYPSLLQPLDFLLIMISGQSAVLSLKQGVIFAYFLKSLKFHNFLHC